MPAHRRIRDLTAGTEVHQDLPLLNKSMAQDFSSQIQGLSWGMILVLNNTFRIGDSIYEHWLLALYFRSLISQFDKSRGLQQHRAGLSWADRITSAQNCQSHLGDYYVFVFSTWLNFIEIYFHCFSVHGFIFIHMFSQNSITIILLFFLSGLISFTKTRMFLTDSSFTCLQEISETPKTLRTDRIWPSDNNILMMITLLLLHSRGFLPCDRYYLLNPYLGERELIPNPVCRLKKSIYLTRWCARIDVCRFNRKFKNS